MLPHSPMATTWAVALAAISTFTLPDPPTASERALLGRGPTVQAAGSNLRLARPEGPVSAERALLGKPTDRAKQVSANETIQIRAHRTDGLGALLGRP
jgi:hypothetical protein